MLDEKSDELKELIRECGLRHHEAELLNLALPAIRLKPELIPEDTQQAGMSKLHNPVVETNERLLLQLDTDKNINMMWGDTGFIYFTIPAQNLENKDFTEVRAEYQGV